MDLEEQQETNLHRNWEDRKNIAKLIFNDGRYRIYRCRLDDGRLIYYTTFDHFPIGYVAGHEAPAGMIIGSTYFSPTVRRCGVGTMTYRAIIGHEKAVISDYERTKGAEALWEKLKKNSSITVSQHDRNQYIASRKETEVN